MNNTVDYSDLFDRFHDCIENLDKDQLKLKEERKKKLVYRFDRKEKNLDLKEINFCILIYNQNNELLVNETCNPQDRLIYLFFKVFITNSNINILSMTNSISSIVVQ